MKNKKWSEIQDEYSFILNITVSFNIINIKLNYRYFYISCFIIFVFTSKIDSLQIFTYIDGIK